MFYSDDIVEEVRTRNDIVDVISEYTGLKKAGNSYKCCCPFHNEKTPSFTVSREKQMYHCFGCGAGGNVYTFVMKYENFTFQEAIQFLAKRAGITLPEKELSPAEKAKISKKASMFEANKMAAAYFHYLLTKTERGSNAYKYYRDRGYSDETIMKFGLGYADIYSDDLFKYLKSKGFSEEVLRDAGLIEIDERRGVHDVFWNRVMVPIADINDKIIAFGGRVMGDGLPKYVNTKETDVFSKSRNLFAMNIARKSKRRGVILCEGYMDVIAQHQAGFDNAIASLGTAFTEAQAGLIKRYTDEVYLTDTYGLKNLSANIARAACGVYIIDDQDFTATEVFCIDMHIVLDIRSQFIVTSDMSPLAATAYLYAVEAVYGSCQPAEDVRETFPASDIRISSAGRYADNDSI